MKIRSGFVSNSSSSSFIVIKTPNKRVKKRYGFPKHLVVDSNFGGEMEFNWQINDYYDVESKIIFAYLQTQYHTEKNWLEILEKVIKENTDVKTIEWKIGDTDGEDKEIDWAYIDHQSNASEGQNIEMFDSEENLKSFLFDPKSFIHTDNDNH